MHPHGLQLLRDAEGYRKAVTASRETIRLMVEIDAAIPKWPVE